MYQRSADMGLGVPFNIASYALLTRIVAQVCNLKAGDFIHTIGDAHIYLNHIDALKVQVQRTPKPFPKLLINEEINDIDHFSFSDFKIDGYNPDTAIKMDMAV
jgi:thymidylate synthase